MNVSMMIRRFFPVVALVASAHAAAITIDVTTIEDQDGTDPANCSLREAVKAINTSIAYGGCPAGIYRANNKVQLKSGTYLLNSELVVAQNVKILGASTYRFVGDTYGTTTKDLLTGGDTSRVLPTTTIKPAVGKSIRIINASTSTGSIELDDLVLEGGNPSDPLSSNNYGGIILSGAMVSLDNVQIKNSRAVRGGAIFLSGAAGLVMNDSTLSGNVATLADPAANQAGGAVDMSCYQDGNIPRSLNISRSSFAGNSSTRGAGAIQMCGDVTATVTASTFSANTSSANSGVLHYEDNYGAQAATLSLEFVTAAENTGKAVLVSSGHASLLMKNSVFAQNSAACLVNGASFCTVNGTGTSNDAANYVVVLPDLSEFEAAGYKSYGGLVDGYLPSLSGVDIIDKIPGCTGRDQRNLSRDNVAKCDIGALERLQFSAVDDVGSNKAGDNRVAYVDVLANDSYSESGSAAPVITKPSSFEIVNRSATELSNAACVIDPANVAQGRPLPRLKVDTNGVVTTVAAPIKCYYRLLDAGGAPIGALADAAMVDVSISNIKPTAANDDYMRPVGVATLQLDLLANDDDNGDGSFATPRSAMIIMIKGGLVDGRAGVKTQLGFVSGDVIDCPNASTAIGATGSVCFSGATLLTYTADNSLSPFTEEFNYSVFDHHGSETPLESSSVKVTIRTNAPDPDNKGGSLDWALLGLLIFTGLRRSRTV